MDASQFQREALALLTALADAIEDADEEGQLEVDLISGVLDITLPDGRHYIINKHDAAQEIWVASPISGGLHFALADDGRWLTKSGSELRAMVNKELLELNKGRT